MYIHIYKFMNSHVISDRYVPRDYLSRYKVGMSYDMHVCVYMC